MIIRKLHTIGNKQYIPLFINSKNPVKRNIPARLVNRRISKPSHQRPLNHVHQTSTITPLQQHRIQQCDSSEQLIALLGAENHSPAFLELLIERLITIFPNQLTPNQFAYLIHISHRRASISSQIAVKTYEAMLLKYPKDARSHTMMRYALPIYAQQHLFHQVISLYHYMETSHLPIDDVLLGIVLHACSKVYDHQTALDIYHLYRNDRQIASQNQLASFAFIGARLSNTRMSARGSRAPISISQHTPFNLVHFTHLIVALYDSDHASYCLPIVHDLHTYGIEPDLFFYTSVMYTLSSRSLWHESLEIMIDMQKHDVDVDEYCYYYAMLSCAAAGKWRRSFSLMDECRHRGLEMVPQLYEAALITAESACLYERTRSLVEEMINNNVHCSVKGYHSLIRQAHAQRDWHWCVSLYRTVMYSTQYHTNPIVNDYVLHATHELNPIALPRNRRPRKVALHDPLHMTMDELFRFQFDSQGILGTMGWWMLARPFLRTLRQRGDSRKHCMHHTLGLSTYLLRAMCSGGESAQSIGCFPIHRICDKRAIQGSHEINSRVFELTLSANHLDESIAALDLIMYVVYYQSHSRDWSRECREAIKALPFAHDEIIIKCIDSSHRRHVRACEGGEHEAISNAPFADYTIMAPGEIDKIVHDPLAPVDASDQVGENLQHAVYRAWLTMKRMFTLRPVVEVTPGWYDESDDHNHPDSHNNSSVDDMQNHDDSSSDFRSVMTRHLQAEYSVIGKPLHDPCCLTLDAVELIAWVKREEANRLKRMVEFNQTKLAANLKKSAPHISDIIHNNNISI